MPETETLTELLADLVAFRTVSGEHIIAGQCLDYVEDYLMRRGMYVHRHLSKGFPSLVATSKKTKSPKVLLQAHLDVVPCPDSLYALREENEKLVGRGVFDMKFAAAAFLKLVDELQDNLLAYDFGIMFTSDEEIGGQDGVQALLDLGYRASVCVLPDAGDNWHIEVTQKGAWIARLTMPGVTAHSSRPWEGENAIHRLIEALREIQDLFQEQAADNNTLSINKIMGGTAANQVADRAEAVLDIRFIDNDSYEQLHKEIRAIAARYSIKIETIACVKTCQTDLYNPFVASFLRVAEEIHGSPIQTIRSLGTSDAHYFAAVNIPTILLRPNGGAAHSDTEWLNKASYIKYYQLIKTYVQKEAKT